MALVIGLATLVRASDTAPPLDPGSSEARRQLVNELAKPEYQTGKANWATVILQWLKDWFDSLRIGTGGAAIAPLGWVVIVIIILVVLLLAFLVFGLPRLNRRTASAGALFGDDDSRDSAALRASAEKAAAAGDWTTAIAEGFRAIARRMSERGVITTFPGTTALAFASQAAGSFPVSSGDLAAAAHSFDSVRYLGGAGSEQQWRQISDLDRALRDARARTELVPA